MHFPRTKEVDTEREKQAVQSLPGYEGRKEYEETGDCFFIEFDSNSISPGEVDYSDDF